MLSNKAYDILKYLVTIVLPAVATLYFALSSIWGFPYCEQIVGTIACIETFIGSLIGISSVQYRRQNDE